MFASLLDPIRRLFSHPQWAWILLWIGLAFLIVALVVMIRTSWGQSHPLRKCAALSLLVHLLLAGYATTVQIVSGNGAAHHGGMNLLLVDGSADGASEGVDDPDAELADSTGTSAIVDPTANSVVTNHSPEPIAKSLPPPLLDVPAAKSPAPQMTDTVESKPETPSKTDDKPTPEITAEAQLAEPRLAKVPDAPPVAPNAVAATDNKTPVEKPTEPLPPVNEAAPLARLPDPPVTSEVSEWTSGPPKGGNLPGQPSPTGPLTDTAKSPDANPQSEIASNPEPSAGTNRLSIITPENSVNGPVVSGPVVESVAGRIAARPVPKIYSDRMATDHAEVARRRGGSPEGESAVQAALRWLAANQSADGRWDADKFGAGHETGVLGQDRQGAGAKADTAVTGLALLAFLGAGNTHLHGDYAKNVQRGLEFLINSQASDGNLAGEAETFAFMYSHGMATLSMSEAYAMTGDKRLQPAVQAAINYTLKAQIRSTGGWRYRSAESPAERGDTSQLGWQLMSLKSAELAGLDVPQSASDGAVRFLKSVSMGQYGGKASYRPGERQSPTMTAEALVCRQFLGMARENPATGEAADYLVAQLPNTDRINLYYWYYGTLGMYQLQDDHWQRWNTALQTTLVGRQRNDGELAGSWDPECIWGGYGGRVYSTALSALCLEVYYRYLPIYKIASQKR